MDPAQYTIEKLLEGYSKNEFVPSEVAATFLERVNSINPQLNSYLSVDEQKFLARAKELDAQKEKLDSLPLYGIPIALKDNFLFVGSKTTAGSKILENYIAPFTATCVEKLENAGAMIVGKTNLDEFAMGSSNENSAFGPVKNPWKLSTVPGGSSGGSAAATAASLCLGALGTDTGGSIRQPASFCGVVGLKPTYGRVSRYGVIAFASSLDQVGPFGKTVWDTARIAQVISGFDPKDSTSSKREVPSYTNSLGQESIKGLKIGIAKDWLSSAMDPDVEKSFYKALDTFEKAGAQVVEIELPHAKYSLSTYYLIAPSEASSNLARYDGVHFGYRTSDLEGGASLYERSRGEGFGEEVKLRIMLGSYALSSGYFDAYYLKANAVRNLIEQDFTQAYKKVDVIASPTSPSTAFEFGERGEDPIQMYLSDVFTLPANLAGVPALSIPSGVDTKGLPIGLQLFGKHFDEQRLLEVAHQYETLRGDLGFPSL